MIQFKAEQTKIPSLTPTYYSLDPKWPITITENFDFTWSIQFKGTKAQMHMYKEYDYVSMMNRIHLLTQRFPVWGQV